MTKVNAYDFDKTLLPYDSTERFFRWCVRRYPRGLFMALPALLRLPAALVGALPMLSVKEKMYGFLRAVPDVDAEVEAFWDAHFGDIFGWYLDISSPDDIIISASSEFLLRPVAKRLGVRLIASRVGRYSGRPESENDHGEEKVRRLRAEYPETAIHHFYSDSLSDTPMARLADRAYLVRDGIPVPWPKDKL